MRGPRYEGERGETFWIKTSCHEVVSDAGTIVASGRT
jgi:hypothetical protein